MRRLQASCGVRTICEVLREINDLVREDTEKDAKIRNLVVEAFGMGKKIIGKLIEYNKEACADWWEKNPEYNRKVKLELRRGLDYKVGKKEEKL